MKKLLSFVLLLSFLTLSLLVGCSKATEPAKITTTQTVPSESKATVSLKDLSSQEKGYLTELEPIHAKVDALFKDFIAGKVDRNKLNTELSAVKPTIDALNKKSKDYLAKNKLSDEDKKNPLYRDGLKYGAKLRSSVSDIIKTTVEGKTVINAEKKDAVGNSLKEIKKYDDSSIKDYYSKKEKTYQTNLGKLKTALFK